MKPIFVALLLLFHLSIHIDNTRVAKNFMKNLKGDIKFRSHAEKLYDGLDSVYFMKVMDSAVDWGKGHRYNMMKLPLLRVAIRQEGARIYAINTFWHPEMSKITNQDSIHKLIRKYEFVLFDFNAEECDTLTHKHGLEDDVFYKKNVSDKSTDFIFKFALGSHCADCAHLQIIQFVINSEKGLVSFDLYDESSFWDPKFHQPIIYHYVRE